MSGSELNAGETSFVVELVLCLPAVAVFRAGLGALPVWQMGPGLLVRLAMVVAVCLLESLGCSVAAGRRPVVVGVRAPVAVLLDLERRPVEWAGLC
jgi:hypothetical protein